MPILDFGEEEEVTYDFELARNQVDEADMRAVLLQAMSRSSLSLVALRSEDIEATPKMKVTAQIKGLGRQDNALEQFVVRFIARGPGELGELHSASAGAGMRMRRLVAVLAMCVSGPALEGQTANPPNQPVFVVRQPTILAFFPPVTSKELDQDPDTNEALSDFQLYANQVRGPLSKLGVDFQQVYARSFRVINAGRTTTFHPAGTKVGYYFVAPGRKPRIEYGVETDLDILQVAKDHFGITAK